MVKPTGKSKAKSKRITCRQRHKVAAKVREHHRKERKEAKQLKASGYAPKQKRDPGVPALHPLKEEILRKAEALKERMEAEKERQKKERQNLIAQSRKLTDLEELQRDAESRSQQFDDLRASVLDSLEDGVRSQDTMNENSRRAYYKEFKKVVDDADVVLEVLDARDPLGCRCASVEQAVVSSSKKRLVLVLNKTDLVPREVVEKWLKYLRQDYPTIAFKASTQSQRDHLSQSSHKASGGSDSATSECFGAGTLIKLLANYTRNANIKTAIRVGIVGYPNVGKSSIINSLKRARVVGVANTPGHTKHAQEISLDSKIKLLDSPGIVFSKNESEEDLILRNCVKLETLQDPVKAVEAILTRCNKEQIMERYVVPDYSNAVEFLQHMSRRLGRLKKGGVPDIAGSARVLLQDWNDGRISYYCLPPTGEAARKAAHVSAAVVSAWGKEFDLGALLSEEHMEIETLRPEKDYEGLVSMTSSQIHQEQLMDDEDGAAAQDGMEDDGEASEDLMSEEEAEAAPAASAAGASKQAAAKEAAKFVTMAKPTKSKAAAAAAAKAAPRKVVVDVESALNRQVNKDKKKSQKQQRRDAAKGLAVGGAYNFATDFTPKGGMQSDDDEL